MNESMPPNLEFLPRNVNVAGCRPPWYLFWFKQWQSLLNDGVQEAFQEFADNYEKISDVPEGFAPHKDVYIHYKELNLKELPPPQICIYLMFMRLC